MEEKIKKYLNDRVDDQITWYDKKSTVNKDWFNGCRIVSIVCSVSITILATFKISIDNKDIIIAILAGLITLLEFYNNIKQHQSNWLNYRQTSEMLKKEKFMFLNNAGIYISMDNPFEYFVERCEAIISSEVINWASLQEESCKKEVKK